jgi:hypothetical protein
VAVELVTATAVDVWVVPANAGIPARRESVTTRIDASFFIAFSFSVLMFSYANKVGPRW